MSFQNERTVSHQPLKIWILCLYFMGLNVSNDQIAHELDVDRSDVHQMTTALREGIVKKVHIPPNYVVEP
jgi:DNA-binding transcriptional regulator LsrR (DeoR family)